MKILHYSLGFPPYRSGGLTKFCMDIMQEQKRTGYQTVLLWPGKMCLFNRKTKLKYRGLCQGIENWEIINPLPVSYDEGIVDIDAFTASCNQSVFINMLSEIKPDVIHIHTLMGLHKEFVEVANKLGIRTVFSVHDYFTICPKVTMFRRGEICSTVEDCSNCSQCNLTALSLKRIWFLQSPIYRLFKDCMIFKKLRKKHRDQYLSGVTNVNVEQNQNPVKNPDDYKRLRGYYKEIISQIDVVHYNSCLTKRVFERFFIPRNSEIISISHSHIKDNRKIKCFGDKLKMTYLGPQGEGKGFFLLKAALDDLWIKVKNTESSRIFSLNIFFTPTDRSPYMKVHNRYVYEDLERIFSETDILIVPSIWYETFGYTVLEALSFGVPVVVSGNVGAKDIIPKDCGIVMENMDCHALERVISRLSKNKLKNMNSNILKNVKIQTIEKMTVEIIEKCYRYD